MTDRLKFTTVEAAKKLGISPLWFRLCAKAANVKAHEVVVTGKRGRPADLWAFDQVRKVEQFIKA